MDPLSPQRADADAALRGAPGAGLVLRAGEPAAGPWREVTVTCLLDLLQRSQVPVGRPRVVAIAGRAGGGKTTLVARLA